MKKCENKQDITNKNDFFNKGIIDWHLLEKKPSQVSYMAQFVPKANKFQLQTAYGVIDVNSDKVKVCLRLPR